MCVWVSALPQVLGAHVALDADAGAQDLATAGPQALEHQLGRVLGTNTVSLSPLPGVTRARCHPCPVLPIPAVTWCHPGHCHYCSVSPVHCVTEPSITLVQCHLCLLSPGPSVTRGWCHLFLVSPVPSVTRSQCHPCLVPPRTLSLSLSLSLSPTFLRRGAGSPGGEGSGSVSKPSSVRGDGVALPGQ